MINSSIIRMIVEKTKTGFSAYATEFPIFTTGSNIAELIGNAYEAVQLYFEENDKHKINRMIHYEIDFKQFFQHYRVLNAKVIAEKIGINPSLLSQCVQGN